MPPKSRKPNTYTTEETEKMRVLARAKQLGSNMELAVRLLAEEA